MTSKTSQILVMLQRGETVTNVSAFQAVRATRLGSIIHNLRAKGYAVETRMVPFTADDGRLYRFAEYRLKSVPAQQAQQQKRKKGTRHARTSKGKTGPVHTVVT